MKDRDNTMAVVLERREVTDKEFVEVADVSDITKTCELLKKPHINRRDVENIVKMRIRNLNLYRKALIHKSILKAIRYLDNDCIPEYLLENSCGQQNNNKIESNERLEYLGDAVINLVIAEYLFKHFVDKDEGFMTRVRTKLVNGKTLSKFSNYVNLGNYILMSQHVINIKGRENNRILEDAFEAFVGAIYLDLGLSHASAFVKRMVDSCIDIDLLVSTDDNYKDILLRYAQAQQIDLPTYEVIRTEGPPHQRLFTVQVIINKLSAGIGVAKSKKEAEQLSAKLAINLLNISCERK